MPAGRSLTSKLFKLGMMTVPEKMSVRPNRHSRANNVAVERLQHRGHQEREAETADAGLHKAPRASKQPLERRTHRLEMACDQAVALP